MKGILDISKLNLAVMPKATRSTNELRPELSTGNQSGKLSLNKSATALMGVQTGDYVKVITNSEAENINEMFYLVVSNDETGCKLSNRGIKREGTGLSQDFSCANVWSIMVQKRHDAVQLSEEALYKLGILVEVNTGTNGNGVKLYSKLLKERVSFKVSVVTDENGKPLSDIEIGDEVYRRLYALTDMETSVNEDYEDKDVEANTTNQKARSIFDAAYDNFNR
jgi:hypothetical protein